MSEEEKPEIVGVMKMLPAAPGTCAFCAVHHDEVEPHNWQSLFYQMRFKAKYGRDATVEDAFAHCSEQMRKSWFDRLEKVPIGAAGWHGWTSPPEGVSTIAEPYAESTGGE